MSGGFDPGQLSVRLDLEQDGEIPDGLGGFSSQWTALASLWAQIVPTGAAPLERAATVATDSSHQIRVRWRQDIVRGMRFRKGARLFMIEAVFDPDESGRFLTCLCKEQG